MNLVLHPRKRRTRAAVLFGVTGAAPGGVLRRAGRGICAYRGGHFLLPTTPVCVSPLVSPLKWQFRSVELRNYFDTFGVGSNARPRPAAKRKNALPERCTTRVKPHFRSFNLKIGSLEYQGILSTRTRKFGPERTLSDPRERLLHKIYHRTLGGG